MRGSSPLRSTNNAGLAQLVERQFCKLDVAGSIPATGTNCEWIKAAALDIVYSNGLHFVYMIGHYNMKTFDLYDGMSTQDRCDMTNGFTSRTDSRAVGYIQRFEEIVRAIESNRLYVRFKSGDRAGSIARVTPLYDRDIVMPDIQRGRRWDSQLFDMNMGYVSCELRWDGRPNKVKHAIPYNSLMDDAEYIIGNLSTEYRMVDKNNAKSTAISQTPFNDFEGKELAVGDEVVYINSRYGSASCLERGKITAFDATGSNGKFKTFVAVTSNGGIESKISDPSSYIYKQ